MKKHVAVLAAIVCLLTLLSGCCSSFVGALRRNTPAPTPWETVEVTLPTEEVSEPTPEPEPTPAPTENGIEYASGNLGFAFTLPASWAGKFRVQEGDGYLCVYFVPQQKIEDGMGKFFTIMKMTEGDEDSFFDNTEVFTVNGVSFVFGSPTDLTYSQGDPEYDTFARMQDDLPAIFQSIKALS